MTSTSTLGNNPTIRTLLTVLGYLGGTAAGITGIVVGAVQSQPGFIVMGAAMLVAVLVAFVSGATAQPTGSISGPRYGGKFFPPDWAWWVAAGVLVAGFVIGGILLAS